MTPFGARLKGITVASRGLALSLAVVASCATGRSATSGGAARGEWVRTETSIARKVGDSTLWRFSFDPKAGKPYFHPVAVGTRVDHRRAP